MVKDEILNKIKLKTKLSNFYELLKNKDYELIYQYFGKDAYNFFAPYDYKKQDLRKLMEEKRYGLIYSKYGKFDLFFIKNLRRYKKEDINKLLKEGKYQDIYNKYGEKEYNKYVVKAYETDVLNETNDLTKMKLYKTKLVVTENSKKILKEVINLAATLQVSITIALGSIGYDYYQQKKTNEDTLSFELLMYNQQNEEYANEINDLNLDDLQIIMKVMNDIWSNMEGYGNPPKNALGLPRLDLAKPGGIGVCRNIADDFTAKMNAINPEYNARNLIVYLDDNYYTSSGMSSIKRKNAKSSSSSNVETEENITGKIFGNYMVTLIDIDKDNITLVVDSTNPTIGYLDNGKIYMLSMKDHKGLNYCYVGELSCSIEDVPSINRSLIKSFQNEDSKDNLIEKYGVDAQNEALEYIQKLNNNKIR